MSWINLALLPVLAAACASAPAREAGTIPVDLLRVGDDGLTLSFEEALTQRLQATGRYRLAVGDERAEIVIEITDHVIPVSVNYFRYDVTFGRDVETTFGRSAGRCMRRRMHDCARRIVAELERALRSH